MAKRFTDTDKYKKPFIRSLPGAYKLFWDYLYHECNNAGLWIVDFEIAQIYIGIDMPISRKKALELYNKNNPKIVELSNGKYWFIPSFIKFQYGILNPKNNAHKSVIDKLSQFKEKINLAPYLAPHLGAGVAPHLGAMDMDMDKEILVSSISSPKSLKENIKIVNEPESEKKVKVKKPKPDKLQIYLDSLPELIPELSELKDSGLWRRFEIHRFEIKKPLTNQAVITNMNTLIRFKNDGENINEVVSQTIANQWSGFFKIKGKDNGTTKQHFSQSNKRAFKTSSRFAPETGAKLL